MHAARIPSERCLAIDDRAGCTLRVVDGQVWITVDAHLRDIIANPGDVVALDRHARTFVSAFRDAMVLIAPPAARGGASSPRSRRSRRR